MADELIDIYTENNEPTGVQKMKSEAHKKGLWHRAAHIWVYNSKKQILIQLRASDKLFYPNTWDTSAAGHVFAGEEPITSAVREVGEEIGLVVEEKDLEFFKLYKGEFVLNNGTFLNNEHFYSYLTKYDGLIEDLKIQVEELSSIKFVDIDFLEKDVKEHPEKYVPHGQWFEVIEKVKSL